MHIEFLVEDSSGLRLLEHLVPKLIGPFDTPHTWRLRNYRGVGRIPRGMAPTSDPSRRILLDQLPRVLSGYAKTPGIDAIVVVVDADNRNCKEFLADLKQVARISGSDAKTMFRIAIEEVEAWYFGDRAALLTAWPRANRRVLNRYIQDSVCGTWERLADAIHPGGAHAAKSPGYPLPGNLKHDCAGSIGPLMEPDRNVSPSFVRLRDGLRRLVSEHTHAPD